MADTGEKNYLLTGIAQEASVQEILNSINSNSIVPKYRSDEYLYLGDRGTQTLLNTEKTGPYGSETLVASTTIPAGVSRFTLTYTGANSSKYTDVTGLKKYFDGTVIHSQYQSGANNNYTTHTYVYDIVDSTKSHTLELKLYSGRDDAIAKTNYIQISYQGILKSVTEQKFEANSIKSYGRSGSSQLEFSNRPRLDRVKFISDCNMSNCVITMWENIPYLWKLSANTSYIILY